ncbi:hypothetical protein JW930_06535 [Candidatus Woesearchaeota archaeon]|nr:hypothetical protein [Candidatus Woesearchaeota archaeon]
MNIKNIDYEEKFRRCKYRIRQHCKINVVWIECPLDKMTYCGNCLVNQEAPNLF